MNTLVDGKYGHGAINKKKDLRDKQYGLIAKASAPFDWSKGYDGLASFQSLTGVSMPIKNQGSNFSCGGQASSYGVGFMQALLNGKFDEKSAHNIYSQIFYPGGGTTLRDIMNLLVKAGASSESLVPSYVNGQPMTEAQIEDTSLNLQATSNALLSKVSGYAFVNPDIDSYAQAIRDNGWAIMEIRGSNNGTWDSPYPVNPTLPQWAHFLFAVKAKMINGIKYIGVLNSWGSGVGDNGLQWISEQYFKSGMVLQGGVVYLSSNQVIQEQTTIMTYIIALLQKFINLFTGGTKIKLS